MIRILLLAAACLLSQPASAGVCEQAADDAERSFGIPAGLLAAIGRVEAGRRGLDGRVAAWPWSVNAAGQGYFLPSAAEAVALVTRLGIRSVDVGCFQVNLQHHPAAFTSIADAFDPASNARAAASFLRDLHQATGNWPDAAGRYHSANPALGEPYGRRVMASWSGDPAAAAPQSEVAALVRVYGPGGLLPGASLPARPARMRLPVVITPGRRLL